MEMETEAVEGEEGPFFCHVVKDRCGMLVGPEPSSDVLVGESLPFAELAPEYAKAETKILCEMINESGPLGAAIKFANHFKGQRVDICTALRCMKMAENKSVLDCSDISSLLYSDLEMEGGCS